MGVPDLSGKYKLSRNENFVEYLEANDVPWPIRKAAGSAPFTLEIQQNGDDFKLILGSLVFKKTDAFVIGQETKEADHFGTNHTSITTVEGDSIRTVMTPVKNPKDIPQTIRDIKLDGDELVISIKFGELECKRFFTKN